RPEEAAAGAAAVAGELRGLAAAQPPAPDEKTRRAAADRGAAEVPAPQPRLQDRQGEAWGKLPAALLVRGGGGADDGLFPGAGLESPSPAPLGSPRRRIMELQGKRAAVLVEQMYQEMEVWYPVYRLREAGCKVTLVGPEAGQTYPSKLGYPVKSDK